MEGALVGTSTGNLGSEKVQDAECHATEADTNDEGVSLWSCDIDHGIAGRTGTRKGLVVCLGGCWRGYGVSVGDDGHFAADPEPYSATATEPQIINGCCVDP